jgi:isoleucyl-tRNA synthetase
MNINEKEEKVLNFWKESKIFKKSVEKEPSNGNYVFYDGPPFITGLPHYATLLPSIAKDAIPRYWTMKGYRVNRVWGWDCHGLPAENKVEKELNLRNKKDVEKLGVDKFVSACRSYVSDCSEQWDWYIDRIGRWVDMDNAYKTMDLNYMESVIWAFKELYEKGLIYEGYRTSLHCPRCATPLSKFEITMDAGSYKDIEEDSLVVKFRVSKHSLKTEKKLYLLAWTTTPWTLPGNLALAVGENIKYLLIEKDQEAYIIAEERLDDFFIDEFKKVAEIKGKDLVGLEYEKLFDLNNSDINNNENVFKVYCGNFVGTEEGTGIVHIAPNFGEDDFNLGKEVGLPIIDLMDENGIYRESSGEWNNYYFDKANKKILDSLQDAIFLRKKHTHSYPFCYRCNTKLIHKTQKAWYLSIDKIREKMIKNNEDINWVPNHFKDGRFKYNLENAPDWCLSRSRYWGSPIPVWRCSSEKDNCENIKVVGSIKELQELSGEKINDLHRPFIDTISFKCEKCGGEMKRVLDVLDCWFESGSMPFAQFHYPYEKKDDWKNVFPSDFIIEYTGQLRGWFYYLHVLSTALFDSTAFKNVIVTGVLAGDDGRKMSKSLGNYPDPKMVLEKYGSDALRLYFMSSPIMIGGDTNLSEHDVQDVFRKNIIILWNVLQFYELFSEDINFEVGENKEILSNNILDQWISSRLNQLTKEVTENLENYNLPLACQSISLFINDLSTWYIRRARNRFKNNDEDSLIAIKTTKYILNNLSKIIAPITPFMAEQVWQKITKNEFKNKDASVHLENWPKLNEVNQEILEEMTIVRKIVELGLASRDENKIKVRQPLNSIEIINCSLDSKYFDLIKDELNVKNILIVDGKEEIKVKLDSNITEDLKVEGLKREMVRFINSFRKKIGLGINDRINIYYQTDSEILKKVFSNKILKQELIKDTLSLKIDETDNEKGEWEKLIIDEGEINFKIEKNN